MAHYAVILVTREEIATLELCPSLEAVRAARARHRAAHRDDGCYVAAIYGELEGQKSLKRNRFRVVA
jgi:hypothetical protein